MSQKSTVLWGSNPSQIYVNALAALLRDGKEYAPRGKKIKELRPVIIEFHDPRKRVTFVKGRVINPFFQLAESLWILQGRSDVKGLTPYNASIAQFSDNGINFNAPYGERLRKWGVNKASNTSINPIDQLRDCYEKLKADPETRQAVAFIGNPHFDSSKYTLKGGKDIACNLNIKFKIRDGALDITVDNRSNDLHWGTFGANLCQFSTIQEAMASWLGVEVGTYFQEPDSLHIYLDDYGAGETDKILDAYGIEHEDEMDNIEVVEFYFEDEPRFTSDYDTFHVTMNSMSNMLEPIMTSDVVYNHPSDGTFGHMLNIVSNCEDEYLKLTFQAMLAKQAHNRRSVTKVVDAMEAMKDSSWKVSCLRFLYKAYKDVPEFKSLYSHLTSDIIDYIERKDVEVNVK